MQREILQEKSLSRVRGNAEKTINVDLSAKSRLIPHSAAADVLSLNDLYVEERNACDSYRMIFTVNPVCTNVLYNAVTEPVYKEGSDSALTLVETSIPRAGEDEPNTLFNYIFPEGTINQSGSEIDQIFAVRDTEISHERIGDFKYHCGFDIFNNHLLRTKEFDHVQLGLEPDEADASKKKNQDQFNTIFDFAIDFSGATVKRAVDDSKGPARGELMLEDVRMYQLDNINTMNTAFYNEFRVVDGWYGFYNTGYVNIPNAELNEKSISINKILNNETPCGFIDMYPDRSLYSFIPKVNRYRKRIERNWDCTIVYPYANDYETFNLVNSGVISGENAMNAVRVINTKVVYNNIGDELIQMHSMLRHTLQPGDEVRILYTTETGSEGALESHRYSFPVSVVSVGDAKGNEEDRYFTIKLSDVSNFCKVFIDTGLTEDDNITKVVSFYDINTAPDPDVFYPITFYYRKVENGYDDKYYFRKFREIKSCEYVLLDEKPQDVEITKVIREPSIVNEDSPKYIQFGTDYYELVVRPLTYTQNKIAYGENIYGDRVAQVIFNDDICTAGLKDNLGRPLSTVYFTAVKTNRGHQEWYDSGVTSADTVEFSHCFGEITSGLDMPKDDESTEYNVRKLHNAFSGICPTDYEKGFDIIISGAPRGTYSGTPMPLESGITLDDFDEFYGDIVEFSKVLFKETTIEKVYHRFNTAQRECLTNEKYFDIHYDDLVGDRYDVDEEQNT